jgi:hypothetical protein
MTAFSLHESDGGRAETNFDPPKSDRDCVTRAITHGTGLPYDVVHDMVNNAAWGLGQKAANPAETGAHFVAAPKILVGDLGWQSCDVSPSALLTVEDLSEPLSKHSVLVVEVELYPPTPVQGIVTGTYHLTAILDRVVHDIASMGANGYAHASHRVKNVFGRPVGSR